MTDLRRLRIAVLVLAGVIIPASTAQASPTAEATAHSGGIGIRLVGVPTGSSSDPLARLYIINRIAPGASLRRQVEVSNSTHSTAHVVVYAAGASLGDHGFTFASGHIQDQLSSWTSVSRGVVSLLPGAHASETVTAKVPKDASSGEDYAVIWAQVSAPSSVDAGVTLVNRVGVRMYVSIGLGGTPPMDFTVAGLTARRSATGAPSVAATVHNIGEGPLDIVGNLTLSNGPGGIRSGPFPVTLGSPLNPGASELATVVLSKGLPDGPWKAVIRLASGPTDRSATAILRFPGVVPIVPTRSRALILVATVLSFLLVLAVLVFELLRRRRRGKITRPALL